MNTQTLASNYELPNLKQPQGFLIIKNSDRSEPIEIGEFLTLGKSSVNQVHLEDSFISQRHARIEKRNHFYFIKDLNSRNGVFLNGIKVFEAPLEHLDVITLGETSLTFVTQKAYSESDFCLESKNEKWQQQLLEAPRVAKSDFPVLINGESGVGKEVLARFIHANSKRALGPFISVNCGALNESLVESELFGHVKGAFTGAQQNRLGAFSAAQNGTLFLDEIGELSESLQPKLLRALENQEVKPVGSDKVVRVNARIVTATHKNLSEEVLAGSFREDLFYRLNVLKFMIPNLRERMEDFEAIFYYFCKMYRVGFSYRAIQKMKEHTWPGNIRELKNTIARASALFSGKEIREGHLDQLIDFVPVPSRQTSLEEPSIGGSMPTLKAIERQTIYERLRANRGNQRQTAFELGMPTSTLHDRIKTYNIDVKEIKSGRL